MSSEGEEHPREGAEVGDKPMAEQLAEEPRDDIELHKKCEDVEHGGKNVACVVCEERPNVEAVRSDEVQRHGPRTKKHGGRHGKSARSLNLETFCAKQMMVRKIDENVRNLPTSWSS